MTVPEEHEKAKGWDRDNAIAKQADEELERAAFLKIVRAMRDYASDAAREVHRWERNYERLPRTIARCCPITSRSTTTRIDA